MPRPNPLWVVIIICPRWHWRSTLLNNNDPCPLLSPFIGTVKWFLCELKGWSMRTKEREKSAKPKKEFLPLVTLSLPTALVFFSSCLVEPHIHQLANVRFFHFRQFILSPLLIPFFFQLILTNQCSLIFASHPPLSHPLIRLLHTSHSVKQ